MKENSISQQIKIEHSLPHKSNFWEFLRNFDIFGITFNFRIETQEKFQSTFGGLWLITFIILTIALYVNTINNYFTNPDFTTYFYEKPLNFSIKSHQINFTQENFDFGIYLKNVNETVFGNNTFIIKGFYTESNNSTNNKLNKILLENKICDPTIYVSDMIKSTEKTKSILNAMVCFNLQNHTIKGSQFSEDYSYFVVEIHLNTTIYTLEELNANINIYPPQFQIIYPNIIVDYQDFSKSEVEPNYLHEEITAYEKRTIDFYVIRNLYEQDLTLFFYNKQPFYYTRYESSTFRSKASVDKNGKNVAFSVNIRALNYYRNSKKYIIKFTTVAQLQLTNLLNYLVFFKIFATFINFKLAKTHLSNKIFNDNEIFMTELKNFICSEISQKNPKENSVKEKFNYENRINITEKISKNFDFKKDEIFKLNKNENNIEKNQFYLKNSVLRNKIPDNLENLEKEKLNNNNIIINSLDLEKNKSLSIVEQDSNIGLIKNNFDSINYKEIKENDEKEDNNNSRINILSKQNVEENLKKILKIEKVSNDINEKFIQFDRILDITFFMKKMEEIELIKYLLLDDKSIFLFNFLIGKNLLFDKKQESFDFNNPEMQDFLKKSYGNLKDFKNENFIENKIIDLFEKYIKNI